MGEGGSSITSAVGRMRCESWDEDVDVVVPSPWVSLPNPSLGFRFQVDTLLELEQVGHALYNYIGVAALTT